VFYADTKTGGTLLALQLYAVVISVVWAGVATFIIILLLDLTIGVRVSEESEMLGLDYSQHKAVLNSSVHASVSEKLQNINDKKDLAAYSKLSAANADTTVGQPDDIQVYIQSVEEKNDEDGNNNDVKEKGDDNKLVDSSAGSVTSINGDDGIV
jgi:hypothetical protein